MSLDLLWFDADNADAAGKNALQIHEHLGPVEAAGINDAVDESSAGVQFGDVLLIEIALEFAALRFQRFRRYVEPDSHSFTCSDLWKLVSAPLQHPAGQSFEFAIRERTCVFLDAPLGNGGVQQRRYLAVKLLFKRRYEFRETGPHSSNSNRMNSFLPGVLIVRRNRENLLEKHLRREFRATRGEFRAAIAAEYAIANDHGGKRRARYARKQSRLFLFKKRNRGKR